MGFIDDSMKTPALQWLADILTILGSEEIKIPAGYREQVLEVKQLLKNDVAGSVNSILDFGINSALVNYKVETDNSNLNTLLNNWLNNINSDLRGKIPVGLNALAKEYFRERWKGSSFLLLRSIWTKEGDFTLPTKLWFVDGEDITDKNPKELTVIIGEEKYRLRTSKTESIALPSKENELIFVQKPFSYWGEKFPVPYIIQRGVYKNLKLLDMLEKKGEQVIGKALEYLLLMKKGNPELAKTGSPNFVYSKDDMLEIKKDFQEFITKRKSTSGISSYVTNFDTEIEHIIPEYKRILEGSLYNPILQRILAGLGLIEIVEGTASTRRESILNPKPFISEINSGIKDFKTLIEDLIQTIVEKNKNHKKYFSDSRKINVYNSSVKDFITKDFREHIRSAFDRGPISYRSYVETCTDLDFSIEEERIKDEVGKGYRKTMKPHPSQPVQQNQQVQQKPSKETDPKEDRTGPEADNYSSYEEAPYKKTTDLPDNVKNVMSKSLQKVWLKAFNDSLKRYKSEDTARKVAWSVIKKIAKKGKDGKWHRKTKASILDEDKELLDALLGFDILEE